MVFIIAIINMQQSTFNLCKFNPSEASCHSTEDWSWSWTLPLLSHASPITFSATRPFSRCEKQLQVANVNGNVSRCCRDKLPGSTIISLPVVAGELSALLSCTINYTSFFLSTNKQNQHPLREDSPLPSKRDFLPGIK